jgi:hypothetical protein
MTSPGVVVVVVVVAVAVAVAVDTQECRPWSEADRIHSPSNHCRSKQS